METKQAEPDIGIDDSSTYERIVNMDYYERECKIAIFGIDDGKLFHLFIESLFVSCHPQQQSWTDWFMRSKFASNTEAFAPQYYKAAPVSTEAYCYNRTDNVTSIKLELLNAFLTDTAYNHKSIKYSQLLSDINHQYPHDNIRDFLNSVRFMVNVPGLDVEGKDDEKFEPIHDEKYDDQITLRTRHILSAEGFIIVYNMANGKSLDDVRSYLNEIFILKGYDKLMDKLKQDQMCHFPIVLFGVTMDANIKDKSQMISSAQIHQLALDYCVDHEEIPLLHNKGWENEQMFDRELVTIADGILDYYKYRSLNNDEIDTLKANSNSDCSIL